MTTETTSPGKGDRELLMLAAKAAGHECRPTDDGYMLVGIKPYWNPLTDDGDALRLAVKRQMTIAFEPSRGGWSVGAVVGDEFRWLAFDEDCRRAIVRCAAASLATVIQGGEKV